jgi:hypothetical protein
MLVMLCGGNMQSSTVHPCDSTRLLFFLFDSLHFIKCVRNNWFNQKDDNQTGIRKFALTFLNVTNPEMIHKTSVHVLKQLYNSESNRWLNWPHHCHTRL